RGGFAIGGFSDQTKEGGVDYLTIFPDMVQFNIQQSAEDGVKGNRGGFAIGGYSDQTKGVNHNFFTVSPDSAKFILSDDLSKGNRGGFAVGGFSDQTKGYTDYLTVNRDSTNVLTNLATTGNVQVQGDIQTGGSVGSLPIVIDGDSYETVTIGNQVWMKENLRTTKYSNGDDIETNYITQYPNLPEDTLRILGKLYSENVITDSRGLCPTGWNVPTENDWNKLLKEVSATDYIDYYLIASDLMDDSGIWVDGGLVPTNSSGFTAVPGGEGIQRPQQGDLDYYNYRYDANYWFQYELTPGYLSINNFDGVYLQQVDIPEGMYYSVRCIKD
ncbi:MAG: fibrobacter succinogenes major paralogous domain-containing protein, partial [Bacteroidales bacterium]|nr:fibrobacter succinogenes major paralogous domain-containing protein [Bacteroidales bacterium]